MNLILVDFIDCQFLQIYNEKIYDLLQDPKRTNPLQIREEIGSGGRNQVHVRGLSEYAVSNREDVLSLLRKGIRNRAIRATDYNHESSRSHSILQVFMLLCACFNNY